MNEWPHKTSTTRNESVGENVRVAIIMEKKIESHHRWCILHTVSYI